MLISIKIFFWTKNCWKYCQIYWFMEIWTQLLKILACFALSSTHNNLPKYTPLKMAKNEHFFENFGNSKSILWLRNYFHAPKYFFWITNMFKKSQNFFCANRLKTFENIEKSSIPPRNRRFLGGIESYLAVKQDPSQHDRVKTIFRFFEKRTV